MTTHSATLAGTNGLDLRAMSRRLLNGLATRAAERRSLAALRRLDDRLLQDVGLTRADVAALGGDH